jgi:hypothetical protein
MHPLLIGAPTVPSHPYNLDQLISEDGTVMIEQPILSVEEETINYFLLSSSSSATTLLQDRTNQPHLTPCQEHPGLRFLVGLGCLRLGYLKLVNRRSSRGPGTSGIVKDADRGANCAHFVPKPTSLQLTQAYSSQSSRFS